MRQRLVAGLWFLMWVCAVAMAPWWMDDAVGLAARYDQDRGRWEQLQAGPRGTTDISAFGEPAIPDQDWSRGLNVLNAWRVANSALARVSRAFERDRGAIHPPSGYSFFYEPEQDAPTEPDQAPGTPEP